MPRCLSEQVIVITGASSGIGRAAAHAFARCGAKLALAARREAALADAVEECRRLGGRAVAVPTDVSSADAVEVLARRAIIEFGRIDVWLNNAAVSLFARFDEAPLEVWRHVIETNLFGYVHGARAALRRFREQGRGVLINNASVVAYVGQPYTSAYVASKFAIRGLGECLRQELRDSPDIHVSTLLPASIDTPIFQSAANYTGRAVRPMPPVYDPRMVAEVIVDLARRPRREAVAGAAGRLVTPFKALAPGLTERFAGRRVEAKHFQQDARALRSSGNIFVPGPEWAVVNGGWRRPRPAPSPIPWVLLAALAFLVVPAGMAAAAARSGSAS